MAGELERLKSSWSDYPQLIDHLINAQIQAEKLRALSAIYRLQEVKLGFVGAGGLTAPSFSKRDFASLKSQAQKSLQSIRRIIFAEGAKGVGPYEELPEELRRNFNAFRYTYREDQLRKLGEASQQSAQAEGDMVNLYSPENTWSSTWSPDSNFDELHEDPVTPETDRRKADRKLAMIPRVENSVLYGPDGEKVLQFRHWVPGPESISTTDPDQIQNPYSRGLPYTFNQAFDRLRESGNTGVFTFKLQNLATGQEEWFPAYIQNIVENVNPTWNQMDFINRSESIDVYQRVERSITLEFFLFATRPDDIAQETPERYTIYTTNGSSTLDVIGREAFWRKMRFIQSLGYPEYGDDGKYKKAPFARFWLGSLFNGVILVIDGLTLNYDPLVWDLNTNTVRPMIAQITLSAKIRHGKPLGAHSDYYGDFTNGEQ